MRCRIAKILGMKKLKTRQCLFTAALVLLWIFVTQYAINAVMYRNVEYSVREVGEGMKKSKDADSDPYTEKDGKALSKSEDSADLRSITVCECYLLLHKALKLEHMDLTKPSEFYHYSEFEEPLELSELLPKVCVELVDEVADDPAPKQNPECFKRWMTKKDQEDYAENAKSVVEALQRKGIWVSLAYGSVVGSVRLHGFLPWDDDMDLMYLARDRKVVQETLKELGKQPNMFYAGHSADFDKLGLLCDEKKMESCWVLDLFPISLHPNSTDGKLHHFGLKYDVDDIVPLRERPFNGMWFPAPARPLRYLSTAYGKDFFNTCEFSNHKNSRKPVKCKKVHCRALKRSYAHAEYCSFWDKWTTELRVLDRRLEAILIRPSETLPK